MDKLKSIDAKLALVKTLWKSRAAWLGIAVATAFLFAACSSAASDPISNGAAEDAAPDFELTLFGTPNYTAGEVIKLSQYQGQPVVLNFWFPSCPPCVAEMPDLEASFQDHKVDGVEFIGVQLLGIDTAEDGQAFVDEIGVTYALGPDESSDITIKLYEVRGFPTTLFLDKDHNIVKKWTGPLNRAKLEELIQEMLN